MRRFTRKNQLLINRRKSEVINVRLLVVTGPQIERVVGKKSQLKPVLSRTTVRSSNSIDILPRHQLFNPITNRTKRINSPRQ